MRGTNSANTTTPPTVEQIQAEMEENAASLLDTIRDELANGVDGLTALKSAIDAIPTTPMRGTDSANTTTPPTVGEIQDEMEENGLSLLDTIRDELANGTDGLSALKTLLDAIKTITDQMRFAKTNELDVNAKSFNDAEIIGDGNATPWDGA